MVTRAEIMAGQVEWLADLLAGIVHAATVALAGGEEHYGCCGVRRSYWARLSEGEGM